jgi:Bacterial protein of unknown function (DUF885)
VTPAERYILLGLRLGRHVDGLVDSYYGPAELQAQADWGDPVPPEQLAAEADALEAELDESWLRDLVHGCGTYARVLAGEEISYSDEVEQCYGVRPQRGDKGVYEAAHAELEELLPGDGTLAERRDAWRDRNRMPADKLIPVFDAVLRELRARTQQLFGLPEGEELLVEEVHDEPWWAFNYYQGNRRSRVVINVDVPTTYDDLLDLAAHEAYPGHHTERATKEVVLVEERGALEETINLVPTPQSVLAEGIASSAAWALGDDARDAVVGILREHGLDFDAERAKRLRDAAEKLAGLSVDAALLIHEDGASAEDALQYLMRWGAMSEERARRAIRFVTDRTWRAYTITYSAGEELVRGWCGDDRGRFKRLLSENVRVSELAAGR